MIGKEKNILTNSEFIQGLCMSCNNAPFCIFRARDSRRNVLYCELFENYLPVQKHEPKSKIAISPNADKKEERKFKGLCTNCENRHTCTYPKPEGGVWHCEEYC